MPGDIKNAVKRLHSIFQGNSSCFTSTPSAHLLRHQPPLGHHQPTKVLHILIRTNYGLYMVMWHTCYKYPVSCRNPTHSSPSLSLKSHANWPLTHQPLQDSICTHTHLHWEWFMENERNRVEHGIGWHVIFALRRDKLGMSPGKLFAVHPYPDNYYYYYFVFFFLFSTSLHSSAYYYYYYLQMKFTAGRATTTLLENK